MGFQFPSRELCKPEELFLNEVLSHPISCNLDPHLVISYGNDLGIVFQPSVLTHSNDRAMATSLPKLFLETPVIEGEKNRDHPSTHLTATQKATAQQSQDFNIFTLWFT